VYFAPNNQNQADLKEQGSLPRGLAVSEDTSSGLFWALGGWAGRRGSVWSLLVLAWGFGEVVRTERWAAIEGWVIEIIRWCCEVTAEDGPLKHVGLAWCEFVS